MKNRKRSIHTHTHILLA